MKATIEDIHVAGHEAVRSQRTRRFVRVDVFVEVRPEGPFLGGRSSSGCATFSVARAYSGERICFAEMAWLRFRGRMVGGRGRMASGPISLGQPFSLGDFRHGRGVTRGER